MAPSSSRYSTTATTTINITKLVKTLSLGATVGEESQQTNFQSPAWRGIREDTALICQGVIEEIVGGKDEIPDQLFGAANIISETSSGISVTMIRICPPIHITHLLFFPSFQSLNNHYKKNFQRLLGEASCLVVILQQLYNNSHSPWFNLATSRFEKAYQRAYTVCGCSFRSPCKPPNISFYSTVYRVHGLMTRKCEKSFVKRIPVGFFRIRDLGKFKKYQWRLDSVASGLKNQL